MAQLMGLGGGGAGGVQTEPLTGPTWASTMGPAGSAPGGPTPESFGSPLMSMTNQYPYGAEGATQPLDRMTHGPGELPPVAIQANPAGAPKPINWSGAGKILGEMMRPQLSPQALPASAAAPAAIVPSRGQAGADFLKRAAQVSTLRNLAMGQR